MLNFHENGDKLIVSTSPYELTVDTKSCRISLLSVLSGRMLLESGVDIALDSLEKKELCSQTFFSSVERRDDAVRIIFNSKSNLWVRKTLILECNEDSLQFYCIFTGSGQRLDHAGFFRSGTLEGGNCGYCFDSFYVPRFDWSRSKVINVPDLSDSLSCQQWLSPPPFCYGFNLGGEWIACGLAVKPGEYNFISFDYNGGRDFSLELTYEGHTVVDGCFETPHLVFLFGSCEENKAVESYIKWLCRNKYLEFKQRRVYDWWRQPIFCGWGQQRYDYRLDHEGSENGSFVNVGNYATEALYRYYIHTAEKQGIKLGTIIIDMGWAEREPYAMPNRKKWIDMRQFIDEQHSKGRKVLLWFTPLIANGLPEEACMALDGRIVAPDPESPEYLSILKCEIFKMLSSSEGCLDADGFKIDFTQNTPSERGRFKDYLTCAQALISEEVRKDNIYTYESLDMRKELIATHGSKWGVEIIKGYLTSIYDTMKSVKADSVLVTQAVNPYFSNCTDILRLNDLDGTSPDVLGIMSNRAAIARMCCPYWLIDTDNDLMVNKRMWREYIQLQPQLGIPDTYYIYAIATSGELFDEDDYELLRSVWKRYREEFLHDLSCG